MEVSWLVVGRLEAGWLEGRVEGAGDGGWGREQENPNSESEKKRGLVES